MALGMWLTMAFAEPRNSPTSDEYWHLTRGVAAVRAPDTRLNRPHPPLAQALAMLPVSLTTEPHLEKLRGWDTASMPLVASAYIKGNYARGRRYLHQGRLMNAALSAALLVFLVVWLRRRFGSISALAVGVLYGTCPIVLAHSALVTNDFGLGAATLLSLAAVIGYLDYGKWWRLLLAALAVSLLPTVKVSGILVLALEAVLPLVWLVRRRGAYAAGPWLRAALRLAGDYALIGCVVVLAINGVYRFDHSFLTLKQLATIDYLGASDGPELLAHWPRSWPVPLPFTYLRCLEFVSYKNAAGHAGMWFGHRSHAGSVLYFPFLLVGKTQALLLPLLLVGFVLGPRDMLRGAGKWLLFVGLGFLAIAMTSKINIGVRHVFPTLVCLLVLGGRAAAVVLAAFAEQVPRLRWPLALAGSLSLVVGVAWSFPAYVGDFNVLIGDELGRQASPIAEDWGQDAADLARELKRRGIGRVAYSGRHSYAALDLENSGIHVKGLTCAGKLGSAPAAAIHLTSWERKRRCYKPLRGRRPDLVIHHDILVFLNHAALVEHGEAAARAAPESELDPLDRQPRDDENDPDAP
jgi:hypothetical protein